MANEKLINQSENGIHQRNQALICQHREMKSLKLQALGSLSVNSNWIRDAGFFDLSYSNLASSTDPAFANYNIFVIMIKTLNKSPAWIDQNWIEATGNEVQTHKQKILWYMRQFDV